MAYSELLKDPRWQRKRLEVMQRDNYTCKRCGDSKNTLHVHYLIYRRGHKPWEYTENELVTLCIDCHEEIENANKDAELWLATLHLYRVKTDRVLGYIMSELAEAGEIREGFIPNEDVAKGFGQRYGFTADRIWRYERDESDGCIDFKTFYLKHKIESHWLRKMKSHWLREKGHHQ